MSSGFLQFGSFNYDAPSSSTPSEEEKSSSKVTFSAPSSSKVTFAAPSSSITLPSSSTSPGTTPREEEKSTSKITFALPTKKTGRAGQHCVVKANHFAVELPNRKYHKYEVTITPEARFRRLRYELMRQLKSRLKTPAVYNGKTTLYTAESLGFQEKGFDIVHSAMRKQYKVVVKMLDTVEPQEAIDTVLRETFAGNNNYVTAGLCFYSTMLGHKQRVADGLECWRGVYQSIKPIQKGLSLMIDTSSTAFIAPQTVDQYVYILLGRDFSKPSELYKKLSDAERLKVDKILRGLKVEVNHRPGMRRRYCIYGLTPQPTGNLTFRVKEKGRLIGVVEYFRQTYNIEIRHTHLPCLQVGRNQTSIYLPMEVCYIVERQRLSKKLNEKQISGLLNHTHRRPKECETGIVQHVSKVRQESSAKDFGITINPMLARVNARVLHPPTLQYRGFDFLPNNGKWDMANKKMVKGGNVEFWICVNFDCNVPNKDVREFCASIAQACKTIGMTFRSEPVIPVRKGLPDRPEDCLEIIIEDVESLLEGKKLDMVIFILPDNNGSLHGDLKRICETKFGYVSQCALAKHVLEKNKAKRVCYFANISLKINVKVGGKNACFSDEILVPYLTDKHTIIFGAHVTHPHRDENSSPSIAALVGSQDWPQATTYAGLVSPQERQDLIRDLCGMIKYLLKSFCKENIHRIIFYRSGVCEGKVHEVLRHEVEAIHKACESLHIKPLVTYIVVNKKNRTRLFLNGYRSGNVEPGTVVDLDICYPDEFDFYLCSHAGDSEVTSRPTHYRVLLDENNFSADNMQILTNYLCYIYARCTRAVSIVAPAYYARLLALRGRCYVEPQTSDTGGDGNVMPLPELKEEIKHVMFYC